MFQAKDGKKFGSSFAGKNYDEKHSPDGMHKMGEASEEANESPEVEQEEQKQGEEPKEETEDTVHPMVSEHGKAHRVQISHDEGSKRHTVQSHHKDGHVHMSVHDEAGKAHEEGRQLAGVPADGQAKDHDSPYHQGKDQASASSEEDSFVMPDLV